MGSIMAKNKADALRKIKKHIRKVGGESPTRYDIKVLGAKHPRFNEGNNKMYAFTIQKKNKM